MGSLGRLRAPARAPGLPPAPPSIPASLGCWPPACPPREHEHCIQMKAGHGEISHPKLLIVSQPRQGIAANPTAPLHHPETVVSRAADPDRRGWGLALHSRAQTTWRPVAPPTNSSPKSGLSAGLQVVWPSWPFSLPHPVPPTEFMPTLGHLLGTDPHTLSRLTRRESRPARLTLACWLITSL